MSTPAHTVNSKPSAVLIEAAGYGVYIHVPFCHSRCLYCDFCSTAIGRSSTPKESITDRINRYSRRAIEEIRERIDRSIAPTTIYIGGGTPSVLPIETLQSIISELQLQQCREFTIEANPEDVTPEWVEAIVRMGANRVSLGIQSLIESELKKIGRHHTPQQAIEAVKRLREGGISNISLDLIFGLPGQTTESWRRSLAGVIDLNPTHLSLYLLSYEPGAPITRLRDRGAIQEATSELCEEMYAIACRMTADAGYEHYEISNFALPGHRAKHNSSYWDSTPYIGIGPGAHSFDGTTRHYHRPDVTTYLAEGYKATLEIDIDEEADHETSAFNDFVITRLRTADGLPLEECTRRYGTQATERLLASAQTGLRLGHLALDGNRLMIPESAWLISDTILVDLIK